MRRKAAEGEKMGSESELGGSVMKQGGQKVYLPFEPAIVTR
jgi:hypothetical protein